MSKLLIQEKKGSTFRLFDLETKKVLRVFERDFKEIDFTVGSLLDCKYDFRGDLIEDLKVNNEIVGDSSKARIEVNVAEVKIGDLIDGVPVLSIGKFSQKAARK